MELDQFLDAVITAPPAENPDEAAGFFLLVTGPPTGGWFEQWFRWPTEREQILRVIAEARGTNNVWFSSYLFKGPSSVKANALPTRTLQADLDEADITRLPIRPSILVRSSPKRHQAYWFLTEHLPLEEHETLSRRLTYAISRADHSGWPVGRKLRIPDTFNFKYIAGPQPVEVIDAPLLMHEPVSFEALPEPVVPRANGTADDAWLDAVENIDLEIGPNELLLTFRDKGLSAKVYNMYNTTTSDRSKSLWALMLGLFKCGAERDQVFWLALHSANNKFKDLRTNARRELAKDVLRAQDLIRSGGEGPRDKLLQDRSLTPSIVRKQTMLARVLEYMKAGGSFMHTIDENAWYVRHDVGRPIRLSAGSRYLAVLMDVEYGLNPTEDEYKFIAKGLENHCLSLPDTTLESNLSWYDHPNRTLYLHSGRRDVFKVTATSVETVVNGTDNIVFPWKPSVEPFRLGNPDREWAEKVFGHSSTGDALGNLIGLDRAPALAMLKAWMVFLLFRNVSPSRPLLATFGQPGSGKSTLFKKVYALLYGQHRAVSGVTNQDEFDQGASQYPLLVLDNADQWERWLPDRLAQSAGDLEVSRRMLYTDGDNFILRRTAMLGITAHNPKFAREDVADRLLLLTFERLPEDRWLPEQAIKEDIILHRSSIWAGIVADVQRTLSSPLPERGPNFRIEDFARIGLWITNATGDAPKFVNALKQIRYGQRSFSLEEDSMLVSALRRLVSSSPEGLTDRSPGQLWGGLERYSLDKQAFAMAYKNSQALGKKLLVLQDALKLIFDIEWRYNSEVGTRLWTIREREDQNGH
jgi:hypothetical protein